MGPPGCLPGSSLPLVRTLKGPQVRFFPSESVTVAASQVLLSSQAPLLVSFLLSTFLCFYVSSPFLFQSEMILHLSMHDSNPVTFLQSHITRQVLFPATPLVHGGRAGAPDYQRAEENMLHAAQVERATVLLSTG